MAEKHPNAKPIGVTPSYVVGQHDTDSGVGPPLERPVVFDVQWASFDNDDMPEDEGFPERDEGWYVDATMPDGTGFDLGPDHFGPGLSSLDHALAIIEKWATDRSMYVDREYGVTMRVTVTKRDPARVSTPRDGDPNGSKGAQS